jgi:sugar phosphate permease
MDPVNVPVAGSTGSVTARGQAYLATYYGWTATFIVASGFCVIAALLATRINPTRSAVV